MEFIYGGHVSSNDHEESSESRNRKKAYNRHTTKQIQHLEAFFKDCPHPDENQRRQLGRELGLEPRQIKFWFQNKRTQIKAHNERADNNTLRAENEKIRFENLAIGEALKNLVCPVCDDNAIVGEEERKHNLQRLMEENSLLKEEHERLSNYVATMTGKPLSLLLSMPHDSVAYLSDSPAETVFSQGSGSSFLDPDILRNPQNPTSPRELNRAHEMEKTNMIDTATRAFNELVELLRVNEPLWVKSPTDGRYILHHDTYSKVAPKNNHSKGSKGRAESSKDSVVVPMNAVDLIELFLDSDKWADMFPTIVTKARRLETLDTGTAGGSLHLMFEQMHVLSPFVAPREFLFLRYCRQLDPVAWVIVDTSYDCVREIEDTAAITRSWKLPSGSLIESLPNGSSKVTWVEHVEVHEKSQSHHVYRDLLWGNQAYGAQRWVSTLQRMCERSIYLTIRSPAAYETEGALVSTPEGKRNLMKLTHRMIKNLSAILSMSDKLDLPHSSESINSRIKVSIRKGSDPGQPCGTIIVGATSLWLPPPYEALFSFLRDEAIRPQWDVLSCGNQAHKLAHLSTGSDPGNCVSIIQPYIANDSSMMLLQEHSIDQSGALLVYAPIDLPAVIAAVNGEDTTQIPILPSGFLISGDGHSASAEVSTSTPPGSLLTIVFQILMPGDAPSRQLVMDSVNTLHSLITTTIKKIKMALGCSDLDS